MLGEELRWRVEGGVCADEGAEGAEGAAAGVEEQAEAAEEEENRAGSVLAIAEPGQALIALELHVREPGIGHVRIHVPALASVRAPQAAPGRAEQQQGEMMAVTNKPYDEAVELSSEDSVDDDAEREPNPTYDEVHTSYDVDEGPTAATKRRSRARGINQQRAV